MWLVKAVIDQAAGTSVDPWWSLGALAFLIAGVGAVIALEPPTSAYVERALNRRITRRVHDRLFTAVGRHRGLVLLENPSFHDRLQLAYAAGVTAPASVVASLLSLVSGLASVAGFLVSLVAIAPVLAVVAALPGLAGQVLLSRRYGRAIRAAAPHERRQEFFAELLTSLRTAKEIRLLVGAAAGWFVGDGVVRQAAGSGSPWRTW